MTSRNRSHLNKKELRVFSQLTSPLKIQDYLDSIIYSDEERYRCPRSVLKDRKAHCYDGAIFAAAALQTIGHIPLIVELLPNENDDDHILAIFKRGQYWGAVAKSNFTGLRYREPVYKSLRELVMSYFESYFNIKGERTLLGYTAPLDLNRFEKFNWLTEDNAMDIIGDALEDTRKYRIITSDMARKLTHVDKRSYKAGLLGSKQSGLFKP
ncbi:MAG: hypothetical protein JXA06_09070 [Bacteroidetes bacterium]|nr:hypothetical protein [Bacteroidota bacterium]